MKKVMTEIDPETIHIREITNSSFVGIVWETAETKSFVAQSTSGEFHGVSGSDIMHVRTHWTKPSVREYVESAIKGQDAIAYVFEDYKELFKWLIE